MDHRGILAWSVSAKVHFWSTGVYRPSVALLCPQSPSAWALECCRNETHTAEKCFFSKPDEERWIGPGRADNAFVTEEEKNSLARKHFEIFIDICI